MSQLIQETLQTIDVSIPSDVEVPVKVAYYRITPEMRDFIELCRRDNRVVGFEYTFGEKNFGIVLVPKQEKEIS